jgi:trafficking protein particle complex subunit 10
MLSRAINTHAGLGSPQDREWIHILLSYLRTYTNDMDKEVLSEDDKYVTQLISALRVASMSLESGMCFLNAVAT